MNLGVRYEFYGVPFDANGKTSALVGGSGAIFGISGNSFAAMYQPGITGGSLTRIQQVGKNSPNPKEKLYNTDWNNLAPAVGLSWGIPWLGKEKTVLRMGYSMGYERHHLRVTDLVSGDQPGLRTTTTFTKAGAYLDLTGVHLPLTPEGKPLETVPLNQRTQTVRSFDENLRTAYYQNWNVSIQRNLGWETLLEVRYVGNKGSKLPRATNVNEVNIFETGILDAFLITQAGGNSPLFDKLFMGLNINNLGIVDGKNITGSDVVRFNSTTRGFLVGNNVGSLANWLNTTNTYTGQIGGLIRRAGLPENFIVVNPQFLNAHLTSNFANSSYHALQVEVSKRLSTGFQFNSNYSWSRTLGEEDGNDDELLNNYRDGRNRRMDKRLLSFHRTHIFKNSGTFELPFGPKKRFLNSNNGVLSRLVDNWQIGFIYNYISGSPLNIESNRNSLNQFGDDNTPDIVGPFPKSIGKATVTDNGVIYFDGLRQVRDPSIANQSPTISNESGLRAIVDASGRLLLVNPAPGKLGTLGLRYLEGPGSFRFHVNLVKKIQIREAKNLELRVDASDALNHPLWGNPNTDINSGDFGRITSAGGARSVVITARLNF